MTSNKQENFFLPKDSKLNQNRNQNSSLAQSKNLPKIVILGGGFGGVYTFLNIRKYLSAKQADITIINRTNHFLFTPMLHEVATGGLAHHQVVEALRSITYKRGATLHVAEINRVDTQKKVVETSVGPVAYDFLVIATGATTNFYNIPGVAEKSLVLKDLRDAIRIRNHLIGTFEKAVETKDATERKKLLTFVVAGGGATGVELAAEMAELFFDTFSKFFCGKIPKNEVSIHLIAGGKDLLSNFHQQIRGRSRMVLEREGVKVTFDAMVKRVDDTGVHLSDGTLISTQNVIWVAGIMPNVPASDVPFSLKTPGGRIIIDHQMRVQMAGVSSNSIFALGDVATFDDVPIPMHAQAAVQAAKTVAANVVSLVRAVRSNSSRVPKLSSFVYRSVGDLVSLGQWQAAGYFAHTFWYGPLAWFVWRTVYLFKFASWPKRIKIAVDWTVDMFYPRDITKA